MGGPGSGPRRSRTPTTDTVLALDIRQLEALFAVVAAGTQPRDRAYGVLLLRGREPAEELVVTATRLPDGMVVGLDLLLYRAPPGDPAHWVRVDQPIGITFTRCHYGGTRSWLICPWCKRRKAVLYSHRGLFWCRRCHGIVHTSTRESAAARILRRVVTIQAGLDGPTPASPFAPGPKPPRMRVTTYQARCAELAECERAYREVRGEPERWARGPVARELAGMAARITAQGRSGTVCSRGNLGPRWAGGGGRGPGIIPVRQRHAMDNQKTQKRRDGDGRPAEPVARTGFWVALFC